MRSLFACPSCATEFETWKESSAKAYDEAPACSRPRPSQLRVACPTCYNTYVVNPKPSGAELISQP